MGTILENETVCYLLRSYEAPDYPDYLHALYPCLRWVEMFHRKQNLDGADAVWTLWWNSDMMYLTRGPPDAFSRRPPPPKRAANVEQAHVITVNDHVTMAGQISHVRSAEL